MTQLLEGYWGVSPVGQRLRVARTLAHRRRRLALVTLRSDAQKQFGPDPTAIPRDVAKHLVPAVVSMQEADRQLLIYPEDTAAIMPTRLGNILRGFEWQSGRQYGLPAIDVAPHLILIAPQAHVDYINDQRTTFDRSVRLAWLAAFAAVVSVVFLWRSGPWLLVACVPYAAALAFYRGALTLATDYGTAVATVLDVNRFALYERLGLPRPEDSMVEREQNKQLLALLKRRRVYVKYQSPPQTSAGG